MLGFLPILLYNYEGEVETFKQGIANGDKDMIYPILKHLLSKLPELRKRAYLSRFLTAIEVPEEMFADPEVSSGPPILSWFPSPTLQSPPHPCPYSRVY
eukprot:221544-Rhodomonas_salina.1